MYINYIVSMPTNWGRKMRCALYRSGINKKILSSLFFICFLTLSISQITAVSEPVKDPLCYGFIAPLFTDENEVIENEINSKIRNMVNDLLREQIPVYWTATNITTKVREIDSIVIAENNMFYGKGSFIIPFTGNDTQDVKIIAVIYDYNQSSEIEDNTIKIPVYELMEPLVIKSYHLSEVRIAQVLTPFVSGIKDYIVKAGKCGFLTFEFIEQQDIRKKLDNNAYNVLFWGGAAEGKLFSKFLKTFTWDLRYKISSTIREFVANGGGYVGSCYGAAMASVGILPFPMYLIRRAYNPNLPSLVFLAISDTLAFNMFKTLGVVEVNLTGIDHPITYGLDTVIRNLHVMGLRFVHIGKNSEVIARFQNSTTFIDGKPCFFVEDTPIWVSSTFGKGKVILFSSHPEMMDEDDRTDYLDVMGEGVGSGKTTISNALFYTTSKGLSDVEISSSRNLSFISDVFDKTSDLTKDLQGKVNLFDDVKSDINETLCSISDLTNKTNHLLDLIYQIAEKFKVNLSQEYFYLNICIASYIKYDLGLYTGYFNNTIKTLSLLERLYPLLKNDTVFIDQIKNLKTDLSYKINETNEILKKSQKLGDECNNAFMSYKEKDGRSKFQESKLERAVRDFYHQTEKGCLYVPGSFLNSLKILRENWYDYEASIV